MYKIDPQFVTYLEVIDKFVIILGLPIAFIQYFRTKKKEKRDREYGTYNALDEKYLEFQKLCLDHPYLNIFDIPDQHPKDLNEKQAKEKLTFLTFFFLFFHEY